MHSPIYFWKSGQVHVYTGDNDSYSVNEAQYTNCFAVDTNCFAVDTSCAAVEMRYGKYLKTSGWKHIPIMKFPRTFRTHLLLLGIT